MLGFVDNPSEHVIIYLLVLKYYSFLLAWIVKAETWEKSKFTIIYYNVEVFFKKLTDITLFIGIATIVNAVSYKEW
jgi:hypothetical protein